MNQNNPIFSNPIFPLIDKSIRLGFTTYKNYLLGLHYLLDLMYPDYSDIVSKLKSVCKHTQKQKNLQKIHSLLLNSWNSELLLNFPVLLNRDILKFSNHWASVQSYYSIYLALRALIEVKNLNIKEGHATTLKVTVHNFIQGEKLFLPPWGVLCDNKGFLNLPQNISPNKINNLENPYHFQKDRKKLWDCICKFLKTTRDQMIKFECKKWKDKNKNKMGPGKKLPAGQKAKIDDNLRAVSIFDYIYRLRIRSNYKDADIFILGSDTHEAEYYFDAICNITDKTLFLIENYIAKYLGKNKMNKILSKYQKAYNSQIKKLLKFNPIVRYKYYS